MTNIEKIRQEIERRKKYESENYHDRKADGRPNEGWAESLAIMGELEELLSFIDSLPEEDLYAEVGDTEEDYIKRSMAKVNECRKMICKDSLQAPETSKENTDSFTSLEEAANEYTKGYYDDCSSAKRAAYHGFIAGVEWQKEQMMKEVKYGVVCKNGERDEEDVWIELNPGSLPDYKDTDPIDFIIVKQ